MTDIEQEARAEAEREAAALYLWDEGLVRPESLAFAVVDSLTEAGYIAGASRPASAKQVSREAVAALLADDAWEGHDDELTRHDLLAMADALLAAFTITARSGAES